MTTTDRPKSSNTCRFPWFQITVNLEKRYQNQISKIESVFANALHVFHQDQPIDKWLSDFMRSNRQIGSRDRKRISNSIFGCFRWYGWIRNLAETRPSLALLLGYLLDENPIDDMIRYWAKQQGEEAVSMQGLTLQEKCSALARLIGPVTIADLNPPCVEGWSEASLSAFQTRPHLWVRLADTSFSGFFEALKKKEIRFQVHARQKECVAIKSPINLFEYSLFQKGGLEVQDIASQGVGLICNPQKGDVWWDVCAGAGGKALHLSSLMGRQGTVYATEVNEARLKELTKRLARNRNRDPIEPMHWNGKDLPCFASELNGILVDAPCSCSGTWRRSPDLRWRITREKINGFSALQSDILARTCQVVPKSGKLVYATCSIFEQENEQVIDRFLRDNPEFKWQPITCPFTGNLHENGIRLHPPEVDGNAMYVAVLARI